MLKSGYLDKIGRPTDRSLYQQTDPFPTGGDKY